MQDDRRIGHAFRALRHRQRMRQLDVARIAGVGQTTVSTVERGGAACLTVGTLRSIFHAVGARLELRPQWEGAALDRLLDERHAALCAALVRLLASAGWQTAVEVTFSHYGDRGSVDVLASHTASGALLVTEAKTDLGSVEETLRMLDVKARLAPLLAREAFGVAVASGSVSRLLAFSEDRTVRRRIDGHAAIFDAAFPVRGRAVRSWLQSPSGPMRGLWFLTNSTPNAGSRNLTRVRVPGAPPRSAAEREGRRCGVVSAPQTGPAVPSRVGVRRSRRRAR